MKFYKKIYYRIYQNIFKLALPLLPYRNPINLKDYDNIGNLLINKKLNNILIITTQTFTKRNLLNDLFLSLNNNNIKYTIYDKTSPNPTSDNVELVRNIYLENNCQGIIAIGGGSAMDLAKIVGARIVKPKKSVRKMKGLLKIRKKLPLLIAIPTTAGSGSEVTVSAVITDSKTHHKYPINDFCLIPHYTLFDPKLLVNLPSTLTAETGMDALTHAVEAFIGNSTTKETRKMSLEAVKLIVNNLYNTYENNNDLDARYNMLKASSYAGIAFRKSYVGYVHAIAHTLGGKYNISHGQANAVILPYVLKSFGSKIYKKLAILSKYSGISNDKDSIETSANKFIDWIININSKMNIPNSFEQIKEEDLDYMVNLCYKEAHPLYPVPVLLGHKELKEIYKLIMKK
jgi:alcohol dehydrogenase class IV